MNAPNNPTLYRATYQASAGRLHRATFAARSQLEAEYLCYALRPAGALPLVVKPLRPLQRPLLELAP